MTLTDRFAHYWRLFPVLALRYTPLPWRVKRWLVWLISPRYAVGVHVVIRDQDGAVLALRSAYSDQWQLPGGGLKYHEQLNEAMRREAREELGLELRDLRPRAIVTDASGRGLYLVFEAGLTDGAVRLSEEHTRWQYLDSGDLPAFYRHMAELTRAESGELTCAMVPDE